MKRILIPLLLLLGLIPWLVAMPCMWFSIWVARLGHWLYPDHDYGNCWSYALPRFACHGGYLLVRPALGVKLLGLFSVPHVAWVRKLPADGAGVEMETFQPQRRVLSRWLPWHTIWYRGYVTGTENTSKYAAKGGARSADGLEHMPSAADSGL